MKNKKTVQKVNGRTLDRRPFLDPRSRSFPAVALYVESEMIQKLKKHGITNIIGTEILLGSAEDYRAETDIEKARGMLERLKPFEQWQREHNHPDAISWTVREFGSMRKFYDWFRGGIVGVIERLEGSSHANA